MILTWGDLVSVRSMYPNPFKVSCPLHELSPETGKFLGDEWMTIIAASTLRGGIVVWRGHLVEEVDEFAKHQGHGWAVTCRAPSGQTVRR